MMERTDTMVKVRPAFGQRLRRVVPFLVSAGCVGLLLLLFWSRIPDVVRALGAADPTILVLAGGAYLLSIWALSARLSVIFRAFGIREALFRFFLFTIVGVFFNSFLPTAFGGDVVKASYAAGRTNRFGEAILATLVDRAIGLIGVLLVGSLGLSFYPAIQVATPVRWLPMVALLVLAVLMVACRVEHWVRWVLGWLERVPVIKRPELMGPIRATLDLLGAPPVLALAIGLTLASVTLSSLSLMAAARALGVNSSFTTFLLLMPVFTLASMLPSINSIGVREATFVIILRGMVPEEKALALSLVFYGLGMACGGIGGVVFVLRKQLKLDLNSAVTSRLMGHS